MHVIFEEIRVALHNVWRRRWLALAVAWAVSLLLWLLISFIPNTYESKASVFVDTKTTLPGQVQGDQALQRHDRLQTIQKTLLSNENLQSVVRGTDLARFAATDKEVESLAEELRTVIEVSSDEQNQMEIKVQLGESDMSNTENARLAQAITQKLLNLYVEQNQGWSRGSTVEAMRNLQKQITQQGVELTKASASLEQFEARYLVGLPGSGTGSVADRLAAARTTLNQLDSQLIGAQGSLSAAVAQQRLTQPTISVPGSYLPGVSGGGGAAAEVAVIEGQIAAGQSQGWTENYPDMISLRSRLRGARARAAVEGPGAGPRLVGGGSVQNPAYASTQAMVAERQAMVSALMAQRAQVQATLDQFNRAQGDNPGVQAEQAKLQNTYDAIKSKYDEMLRQQQDIAAGIQPADSGRVKVITPPSPPISPVAPNRPLLLTLGLIVGLAVGGGAAFAMSQIRATYANANRLEKATGLPVLGAVSAVIGTSERTAARQNLRYFMMAAAALVGVLIVLLAVELWQRGVTV